MSLVGCNGRARGTARRPRLQESDRLQQTGPLGALARTGFGILATMSTGIARHVERDHPDIRTIAFGNAEFHDPEDDTPREDDS